MITASIDGIEFEVDPSSPFVLYSKKAGIVERFQNLFQAVLRRQKLQPSSKSGKWVLIRDLPNGVNENYYVESVNENGDPLAYVPTWTPDETLHVFSAYQDDFDGGWKYH